MAKGVKVLRKVEVGENTLYFFHNKRDEKWGNVYFTTTPPNSDFTSVMNCVGPFLGPDDAHKTAKRYNLNTY